MHSKQQQLQLLLVTSHGSTLVASCAASATGTARVASLPLERGAPMATGARAAVLALLIRCCSCIVCNYPVGDCGDCTKAQRVF